MAASVGNSVDHVQCGGQDAVANLLQPRPLSELFLVRPSVHSSYHRNNCRALLLLHYGKMDERALPRWLPWPPVHIWRVRELDGCVAAEWVCRVPWGLRLDRPHRHHALHVKNKAIAHLSRLLFILYDLLPLASHVHENRAPADCVFWEAQQNSNRPNRRGQPRLDRSHAVFLTTAAGIHVLSDQLVSNYEVKFDRHYND